MAKKSTTSNPLYVVTNQGQDVEAVANFWDALVKKFHLRPFIEAFEAIFNELFEIVKSYPLLVSAQKTLNEFIEKIEELSKLVGLSEWKTRS